MDMPVMEYLFLFCYALDLSEQEKVELQKIKNQQKWKK